MLLPTPREIWDEAVRRATRVGSSYRDSWNFSEEHEADRKVAELQRLLRDIGFVLIAEEKGPREQTSWKYLSSASIATINRRKWPSTLVHLARAPYTVWLDIENFSEFHFL